MEKLTFYERVLNAKKEIGIVTKNAKNPHFKNTYADVNAIISEVEPVLLNHNLILLQPIIEGKQFTIIQDALSDTKLESYLDLPLNMNPQQMGSAITYFRRYTLQSLLSLRAEDDDAQVASTPTQKQMMLPPLKDELFQQLKEAVKIKLHSENWGCIVTLAEIKKRFVLSTDQEKELNLIK